jgi:hypothetical protein
VRDPARQERDRSSPGLETILAADDLEPAIEHVEGLVLVVVDVQRRARARGQGRLHQEQLAAGRGRRGLEREGRVGEPDPLALAGAERDRCDAGCFMQLGHA